MGEENNEVQYPENEANNYRIVDHILVSDGVAGQYSVYFKKLSQEDFDPIADATARKINYKLIPNAPQVPNDDRCYNLQDVTVQTGETDPETGEPITITTIERTGLKELDPVAFTGVTIENLNGQIDMNWNNIQDAPGLPNNLAKVANSNHYIPFDISAFQENTYDNIIGAPALPQNLEVDENNLPAVPFDISAFQENTYDNLIDAPQIPNSVLSELGENDELTFDPIAFNGIDSLDYEQIEGAPGLPDYLEYPNCYNITESEPYINPQTNQETVDQIHTIKDFDPIAFTGFNTAAIKPYTINVFTIYDNMSYSMAAEDTQDTGYPAIDNTARMENINNFVSIGTPVDHTISIIHLNTLQDSNGSVEDQLRTFIENFKNYAKSYIQTINGSYLVTDINIYERSENNPITGQGTPYTTYAQITLLGKNLNNYIRNNTYDLRTFPMISKTEAEAIAETLEIQDRLIQLIYDYQQHVLYYISVYGNDYLQLINQPTSFLNIEDFANFIDTNDNNKLLNIGSSNLYLLNLDNAVNNNNIKLLDFIELISNQYIRNTILSLKLYTPTNTFDIINIKKSIDNNNNIIFIQWDLNMSNFTNYDTLSALTTITNDQILEQLTITEQKSTIIFDYQKKCLYSKVLS